MYSIVKQSIVCSTIFIFILSSCNEKRKFVGDLEIKEGLYINSKTKLPFSGQVFDTATSINSIRYGQLSEGYRYGNFDLYSLSETIKTGRNQYLGFQTFDSSKLNGPYVIFYESGDTNYSFNYRNNKLHGSQRTYHRNRTLNSLINYNNGIKDGAEFFYNETGEAQSEYYYLGGKYHGTLKTYYNNGILRVSESFKTGVRNGVSKYYNYDGTKKKEVIFSNGEVKKIIFFNTDESPQPETPVSLIGIWKSEDYAKRKEVISHLTITRIDFLNYQVTMKEIDLKSNLSKILISDLMFNEEEAFFTYSGQVPGTKKVLFEIEYLDSTTIRTKKGATWTRLK